MDIRLSTIFAYFEYLLSLLVPRFVANDGCLDIVEIGQYGLPTIYFQRLTVIISELVLFYALQTIVKTSPTLSAKEECMWLLPVLHYLLD